jgi:hypothetical protein
MELGKVEDVFARLSGLLEYADVLYGPLGSVRAFML